MSTTKMYVKVLATFVKSWISHPYKTQYSEWHVAMRHCIHQWLSYNVIVGSITKVWQPFTTNMNTREVSGINDVLSKLWLDFCKSGFLTLTRLNISVACCNEALYVTNDCGNRPVRSITKVWQPFTTNMNTRKVSGINDVLPKLWLDFCIEDPVSHPYTRLNISAACCNEALYPPMIVTIG